MANICTLVRQASGWSATPFILERFHGWESTVGLARPCDSQRPREHRLDGGTSNRSRASPRPGTPPRRHEQDGAPPPEEGRQRLRGRRLRRSKDNCAREKECRSRAQGGCPEMKTAAPAQRTAAAEKRRLLPRKRQLPPRRKRLPPRRRKIRRTRSSRAKASAVAPPSGAMADEMADWRTLKQAAKRPAPLCAKNGKMG